VSGSLRQIVAFGGGGFSMEAGNPLLDDYVLGLSGKPRPKVCFLPSASGDADHYIVRFYRAFDAARCEPSHVSLFRREAGAPDLRAHLLDQDVIYVGGGSVISLLGVWRAHGLDVLLREAWINGVVLCGVSAGSLCWFREAVTAFHGEPQRVAGLDLLPWSNTVHYDGEQARDRSYRRFLVDGLCPGYAAEDGAALHFVGERLVRAVSSRPHARAYRMRCVRGRVVKSAIRTRYLAEGALPALASGGGGRGLSVAPDSGPAEVCPPTSIAAGARS
jgi:dipeptidase E